MVLKPFDIEAPWFTELLEAIGQPNGLNCEHHNYLRMQEFESPGDRAGRQVDGKRCRRIDGIFHNLELAELLF